jgi:hypothetical protein
MSTSNNNQRRQPERNAKTQAAREQMGKRKLRKGMLGATPNSHYLAMLVRYCNCLRHTDQVSRAQKKAEDSAFLRLPAEIRNRIWSYVVSVGTVFIGKDFFVDPIDEYPEASILRVCRQIDAETCLLSYSVNLFYFWDYDPMVAWLKRRLPEQKAAVKRMRIFCSDCAKLPLREFHSLESVVVCCIWQGTRGNSNLDISIMAG